MSSGTGRAEWGSMVWFGAGLKWRSRSSRRAEGSSLVVDVVNAHQPGMVCNAVKILQPGTAHFHGQDGSETETMAQVSINRKPCYWMNPKAVGLKAEQHISSTLRKPPSSSVISTFAQRGNPPIMSAPSSLITISTNLWPYLHTWIEVLFSLSNNLCNQKQLPTYL